MYKSTIGILRDSIFRVGVIQAGQASSAVEEATSTVHAAEGDLQAGDVMSDVGRIPIVDAYVGDFEEKQHNRSKRVACALMAMGRRMCITAG